MTLAAVAFVCAALGSRAQSATHPLDPLTAAELSSVRLVLERAGRLGPAVRFGYLALREPPKAAAREPLPARAAEAILFDWATSTPYRAVVDLGRLQLVEWDSLPSREPPTRNLIRRRLDEIVRPDPRWRAALLRRGIGDPALVTLLPNLAESRPLPWRNGDRVVFAAGYDQELLRTTALIRGIRLEVNLSRGTILELSEMANPDAVDSLARQRAALVGVVPPRPSARIPPAALAIQGSAVQWKNWRLHFGVHPRRGLELWDIAWMDGSRKRSILYRASISEAMAAYGDPDFTEWYPRDAGNAGLGDYQGNSAVELGDAPPGASFVDAVLPDDFARPVTVPRAVTIYERDGGVLWRHAGSAQRGRQLVLSSHATIDDYDFVFHWIFSEDGAIDVEVQLTGIVLTHPARPTPRRADVHGSSDHQVAPGVFAPNHQHFFSYRLDFDIEGAEPNRVLELESAAIPRGRANPDGLWWAMHDTPLASERGARRNLHTAAARKWRVVNPSQRNSLGDPVGYTLQPGEVAIPYASIRSRARSAGGFVGAQLWVTPWRRDEFHAAGEFVNFNLPDDGLPRWTAANRNLLDTDVVLWYTLGVTHVPRPEDYPVMPAHRASFRLIPTGFFSRNPALPPRP